MDTDYHVHRKHDCDRPGDHRRPLAPASAESFLSGGADVSGLPSPCEPEWEELLAARIRNAPIPADLEERIRRQLGLPVTQGVRAIGMPSRRRVSRRLWICTTGAAAAAGLAAVIVRWMRPPIAPTPAELVAEARRWYRDVTGRSDWQNHNAPVSTHPFPARGLRAWPVAWLAFSTPWDPETVAYRLQSPRSDSLDGVLFVVRSLGRGLGRLPPGRPLDSSQGMCLGAWANRDLVFVLAIAGAGISDYRALLETEMTLA